MRKFIFCFWFVNCLESGPSWLLSGRFSQAILNLKCICLITQLLCRSSILFRGPLMLQQWPQNRSQLGILSKILVSGEHLTFCHLIVQLSLILRFTSSTYSLVVITAQRSSSLCCSWTWLMSLLVFSSLTFICDYSPHIWQENLWQRPSFAARMWLSRLTLQILFLKSWLKSLSCQPKRSLRSYLFIAVRAR